MADNISDDDEVITVRMPKGDYKYLREMIDDRKTMSHLRSKFKIFSMSLAGVVASWMLLGDYILQGLRRLLLNE